MEASAEACLALILQTPAIATEPLSDEQVHTSPIGIHILGQDAHLLLSLWALKSFYHFAHVHYPLTVHLQGKNTQQMVSIVSHHFPQARLISQEAADAFVEPWLQAQDFKRLLATRSRYFPVMKLIDLRLLARTPLVLYFDTDVLFFQHPHELLSLPADISAAPHLFMRDDYPSYCITPSQARIDFGIDLIAFANSGVMRLVTDAIDLAACERFHVASCPGPRTLALGADVACPERQRSESVAAAARDLRHGIRAADQTDANRSPFHLANTSIVCRGGHCSFFRNRIHEGADRRQNVILISAKSF